MSGFVLKKYCLLTFIFISYSTFGQINFAFRDTLNVDTLIKEQLKNNSESDVYYKLNRAGILYSRHSLSDSIFKYVYEAIHDYPVINCWLFRHEGMSTTFNSDYPDKVKKVCKLCDSIERNLDSPTIQILVNVRFNDLKYRGGSCNEPWITGNEETAKKQHLLDSINQKIIEKITNEKKRYIGADIVGYELCDVAFMVIQHAHLDYQERNLPLVEQAIKNKYLYKSCYPLLIDRILMQKGLPQIFGTQVIWNKKRDAYELYKVKNISKVNELRKQYQLNSLGDYLHEMHAVIPHEQK